MRTLLHALVLTIFVTICSIGLVSAQSAYQFTLGFKTLADQIPDIVGQPVENEHHSADGDSLQRTTTGLMVWRKADNWTAFTDGARTWINGPFGIQERANQDRFPWETGLASTPQDVGTGTLFSDTFAGGVAQLPWAPFPYFNLDNLTGTQDPTSPSPEKGVGILTNNNAGGFAALSYVTRDVPSDFFLESWVYVTVTQAQQGALNGLVFRADPGQGRFFRVAGQFAAQQELTLAYVGQDTQNFPIYLARWKGEELPGGPLVASGWHKIGIRVVSDSAEVYWDGTMLPGGPFPVDRSPAGFVGVYATYTGGLGHAETRVDDFTVSQPTQ